jgi:hypothetical protein
MEDETGDGEPSNAFASEPNPKSKENKVCF